MAAAEHASAGDASPRRALRGRVAVFWLVAAACSSEAVPAAPDASATRQDASATQRDGSATQPDASLFMADAAAPDSGATGDAGGPPDSGATPVPPSPACRINGCLRSVRSVGRFERDEVTTWLAPGLSIDNGYAVYVVRFATDGRDSTATVTLPIGRAPPPTGYAIIGSNHGTTGIGDACTLAGTDAGAGLAGLFGARGMIGVAVDYAGLGTDGPHPYLVSRVEATSALDGLRAATQLAINEGVPTSGRYAMVGVSQGGHATLAAAAAHADYAPELDIRAFGATAPASAWEAHWSAGVNVPGTHLAFHALLMAAWSTHYGWPPDRPLWAPSVEGTIEADLDRLCASSDPSLFDVVPADPAALFHPDLLAEYSTRSWRRYTFVRDAFATNELRPWRSTAPVRIYQGGADTIVPQAATAQLVAALIDGGVDVDYRVVADGTHFDVAFGFLAFEERRTAESIAWIRSLVAR